MTDHAGFVLASYAVSVFVIGGLALWIWLDHRARKAELAALEQAGVKRRSAKP